MQARRKVVQKARALRPYRLTPCQARILGRRVLKLEQMRHNRRGAAPYRALQRAGQVLDLLDQVLEIERIEPSSAQQGALGPAPRRMGRRRRGSLAVGLTRVATMVSCEAQHRECYHPSGGAESALASDGAGGCRRRSLHALARSRSMFLWTLPVEVLGSSAKTRSWAFEVREYGRQWSIRSAPLAAAPSLRVTYVTGSRPLVSGRATTAASSTAGGRYRVSSTSIEEMFRRRR